MGGKFGGALSEGGFICFCLALVAVNGQDFGYDGREGPSYWSTKYSQCAGKFQSPINIESADLLVETFSPLIFHNFDNPIDTVSLKNNGHTVKLTIKDGPIPTLEGGPLNDTYQFAQLHFHWGQNDTLGSENQINHHSFPLELHMVLFNLKYKNFDNAVNYDNGLAVLSFLYSISDHNAKYDQFEDGLYKVQNMSSSVDLNNFISLDEFTTNDRINYVTYKGSLTTPPCSEVVQWIEFLNTIPLSRNQTKTFRLLLGKEGHLTHNYRPIQPLHGRRIYLNKAISYKAIIYQIIFLIWLVLQLT